MTIDDEDDGFFEDSSSISSGEENVDEHDKRDIQLKSSLKNEKVVEEIADENKVTIGKLLCSARFTMAALSCALCDFLCVFMEPILAERISDFDLTSMQIGMFFAILPIFYIPSSIMVCYLPNWIDKRFTIIMASALSGVAFIFIGPSKMFGLPDELLIMGIG